MTKYMEDFYFVDGSTALLFTAAGALLAARHTQIFTMNQHT
jgi:hypothetical protein